MYQGEITGRRKKEKPLTKWGSRRVSEIQMLFPPDPGAEYVRLAAINSSSD